MTHNGGQYDIAGLAPWTYTVYEVLHSGWTQTAPVPDYFWTLPSSPAPARRQRLRQLPEHHDQRREVQRPERRRQQRRGHRFGPAGWTVDLEDASGNILAQASPTSAATTRSRAWGRGATRWRRWCRAAGADPAAVPDVLLVRGPERPQPHGAELRRRTRCVPRRAACDNSTAGYTETGTWSTAAGGLGQPRGGVRRTARPTQPRRPSASPGCRPALTTRCTSRTSGSGATRRPRRSTVKDGGTSLGTKLIDESILVTQAHGGLCRGRTAVWAG